MASQAPEYGSEQARTYDDEPMATIVALVGAVLGVAGIIGLFMFITWFAYATN